MKNIPALLLLLSMLIFPSCEEFSIGSTPGYEVSIYPGECLSNLSLDCVSSKQSFLISDAPCFCIGFNVHWDIEYEHKHSHIYFGKPAKEVYNSFEKASKKVKNRYNELFDKYNAEVEPHNYEGVTSTVYYCGGLVMTADKEFAGVPAGENLEPVILPFSDIPKKYGLTPIPTINIPDGYSIIGKSIGIYFPIGSHELVAGEEVTFHLEIPVKVGLLLTLLRDRLIDPDAQMQYRDEVLTCDFTINHGLH